MAKSNESVTTEGGRYGDDTPPLFSSVRDESHYRGCITSQARTASAQYIEFLNRHRKELNDDRR